MVADMVMPQKVVKPKDAETKDVHLDILKHAKIYTNADKGRCMYQHSKDVANNTPGLENNTDDITLNLS